MTADPIWTAIPEHELVPYQALSRLPVRSLLVLAPHPDDEVLGCGGLLALAAEQGVDARVVVVSNGAVGGDAALREEESRQALRALGLTDAEPGLQFWRLPDRGLMPDAALVERIRQRLDTDRPEWLLVTSPFEVHPDHRALCLAAMAAITPTTRLGFYEVGQPLMPNTLIDISAALVRKQAALKCYPSQLASQAYDEQMLALNRFRAYTLGPSVTHAEALWFPQMQSGLSAATVQKELIALLARRLGLPVP